MKVLYLSYDGLTDPLGGSQIMPYLVGLARRGHEISVVSFEKPDASPLANQQVRRHCSEAGIDWHPMRYHKRPPILSTVRDIAAMQRRAFSLHRECDYDLVHCRSYVPALAGLALKRRRGVRFLFDMRGFWPEERVEGGGWDLRNPLFHAVFRFFKQRERSFLAEADAIVSLTNSARDEMQARPGAERPATDPLVIPCCVDLEHFRLPTDEQKSAARDRLGIAADAKVLCYLGSLGGNYLLDEMLLFFKAYRERWPGARFLFITREPEASIVAAARESGIASEELVVRPAHRNDVPGVIAAADHAIAFKTPSFAQKACSPTKIGEMMAIGVPVVANAGVGDVDAVIEETGAGIIVRGFDSQGLERALNQLAALRLKPASIREGARRWFDLEKGVAAYDNIYRALAGHRVPA